ncbi:MAG TPA: ROK family protein [Actinomycetota bacterium]|nr:ROK family protein [Actinomycetota bacterium]
MSASGDAGAVEAVGLDIGGTKIAGYRIDAGGRVLERALEPTPPAGPEEVAAALESMARRLARPESVAVGVGVAGLVEAATGIIRYGPNLPFREIGLRERIERATGLPCVVDNDAAAAGWGEFRCGAGRDANDMLLVTVGTGIGGAIVAGGRLFRGAHGFAAEIGHIIVEPGGPRCGCGNRGCWEQVASGRAIDRMAREAVAETPESLILKMAGGDPSAVRGPHAVAAAKQGDPLAIRVLADAGRRLGEGIAGLVNIIDPDIVVIGGGAAMGAGEFLLEPAREASEVAIEGRGYRPPVPIVPAELGNDAGGIGAGLLALEGLPGGGG